MTSLEKTVLNAKHRELAATIVDFGGWDNDSKLRL